jgi:N-acetyl-anhydromuramyl-L-alanine amidase AmpD
MILTTHTSPNHSSRGGRPIKGVVIHATAGGFQSALSWLTSPHSRVSAHYLIAKSGAIYRLVPHERAAWHAGKAAWLGETQINEVTIGIELENANSGRDPYPEAQVTRAVLLCRDLVAQYRIAPNWLVRHSDVALPKGRKTDPAPPLDWGDFTRRVFSLPHHAAHYRTRAKVWVRDAPDTKKGAHVATIAGGTPLPVYEIKAGAFVRNSWGASDLWARTDAGWIWLPQLEAL